MEGRLRLILSVLRGWLLCYNLQMGKNVKSIPLGAVFGIDFGFDSTIILSIEMDGKMWKSLLKFGFGILLAFACITLIVQMRYGVSVPKYLAYSMPLTYEESDYLDKKGELVFGIEPEGGPLSSYNEENGEAEGFICDYVDALAIELGTEIKCVPSENPEADLNERNVDLANVPYVAGGNKAYLSAQEMYEMKGVIVSMEGNRHYALPKDLSDKRIIVVTGGFQKANLSKELKLNRAAKVIETDSTKEGLELLVAGKGDMLLGIEPFVETQVKKMGIKDEVFICSEEAFKEDMTIGINVYDSKLLNIVNKGVFQMKKTGTMRQLEKKWLGSSSVDSSEDASIILVQYIMLFCVAIVLFLMLWEGVLNRRIEAKTREINIQKNNMQLVLNNVDSMLVLISRDGIIENCNRRGCEIIGKDLKEILKSKAEDVEILSCFITSLQENPEEKELFYNGRFYNVTFEAMKKGQGSRLLVADDFTEKKFAEQKLRQQSKMIAIGQLSAGLAHEIRNPLGLIKNYSFLLKNYAVDDMSQHSLQVIGDSVSRINNLIENLLKFSRLSGEAADTFDLKTLLDNIFALEKKKLEKQNVIFNLECPENSFVYMREETIKLITYNLLNNAIDAMAESEEAGEKMLSVKAKVNDGMLEMEFHNTGPQIPVENLENIFNPFFTTKETGTGLGLYIVSSEADKAGGSVSVTSNENETVFMVSIPMEVRESEGKEEL